MEGATHVPAPGATCDTDGDICSGVGVCDTTGQCVVGPPLDDGTECDDGEICNGVDTCLAGMCQVAAPAPYGIDCWDGTNACVTATCDGQGACIQQSALQGRSCDDGSACTAEDHCDGAGQCAGTPLADGGACADGDTCNGAESCMAGACIPGTPVSTDDGDSRTLDTCDPATGIVHHTDCSTILDLTVTTTLDVAAQCLYQGPAPAQVALDGSPLPAGAFDGTKLAIVRGRVRNNAGVTLDNVVVTVPARPGWGKTFTRADGRFDLVVEAGAPVVLRLTKPGLLTAYRTIEPAAQQYAFLYDVQLTLRNPVAVQVDLGAGPQIAKGTLLEDQRGRRQAAIAFQSGTTAMATLPDGTQVPMTGAVHVRATEYTFGTNAPASMPAPQPPSTTLTFCAELSIDEAEALGAARVDFSQPVYVYLDNFLRMQVGAYVPSGYFDEADGVWKPSVADGLVVQVKDIQAGKAILVAQDANGNDIDVPDLTPEEQEQIARLYPPGKSFWRMPLTHFTTVDFNFGNGPPSGATFPDEDLQIEVDAGPEKPCPESGSIIGCESGTLGEALPITGSGLRLFYDSARVPGRMSVLRIPVAKNLHPEAIGTYVEVSIAGHHGRWEFDKDYEGLLTVAWSGHDAMGRLLQGAQPGAVIVGNRYVSVWDNPGAFGARGRVSVGGAGGGSGGGSGGGGGMSFPPPGGPAAAPGPPIDLRRHYGVMMGHWNSVLEGLGGWSIEAHHAYDVLARTLYRGDGTVVHADTLSKIRTFAGNGLTDTSWNASMEGTNASAVPLPQPERLAVGPDGSVYVTGTDGDTIVLRIAPDRTVHRFAGTGSNCWPVSAACGNDGPALSAFLGGVMDIAVGPDGSVYLAELSALRIRRVRPDGIIEMIAGNGQQGGYDPSYDGMLATQAPLAGPKAITVGGDGSVYFADGRRVHRIDPSGRRWHVAGSGVHLPLGMKVGATETPAGEVSLGAIEGLALSPGGELLVAHNHLIGAVTPHLTYRHVAGEGPAGYEGDGGMAHQARLTYPKAMVFDADGALLFADSGNNAVRRIEPPVVTTYGGMAQLPNGRIRTIAGRSMPTGTNYASWCPEDEGPSYLCGDGGVSTEAFLRTPRGLARGPAGKLFVALYNDHRIAVVEPVFPGYGEASILVPSPDADEYYLFDPQGKHLETRSALTNALRFSFEYDAVTNRLFKLRDVHDQELIITGNTIMAPGSAGDTYGLTGGYLTSLTNPENETFEMSYWAPVAPGTTAVFGDDPDGFGLGLLNTLETPRGSTTMFTYDTWGRLTSDVDAAGGALNLTHVPAQAVTGTALVQVTGRPTGPDTMSPRPTDLYEWQLLATGDLRRRAQIADGVAVESTGAEGGSYQARMLDAAGTLLGKVSVTAAADPRFGPYAGYAKTTTVESGPIAQTIQVEREVTLSDPDDVLSASALHETTTVGGSAWQSHFDVATRTLTSTSPEGRVSTVVLDDKERVTSITPPGREPIAFAYDPAHPDQVATVQIGTTTPRVTSFSRDAAGRLDLAFLPNDVAHSFGFDFDGAWRPTAITDPLGGAVGLGRDADGNVTSVTMPELMSHGLSYTPVGLLQTYTPPTVPDIPGSPQMVRSYNLNRTLDDVTRLDNHVIDRGYDTLGRLDTVNFDAGTLSYTYDVAGRTETATRAAGGSSSTLTFTYDGLFPDKIHLSGAPFGVAGATFTVDQAYNSRWLLQSEGVAGKMVTYGYDGDGLLTAAGPLTAVRNPQAGFIETTTLGVVGTSHGIDPGLGAPEVDGISSGGTPRMTIDYVEYDAAGRLKEKVESVPGEAPITHEYVYDLRGWLTDEYRGGTLVAHFEYDANGNRTAVAMGAGAQAKVGVYDDQDRLTQLGDVAYQYTENGELHTRSGLEGMTTYTYDDLGVLLSVARPDGIMVEYVADALGRRIAKKVNNQVERGWLYGDGLLPLAEVDANGVETARFVYLTAGAPDVIVYYDAAGTETRYRVFKDHLGSPRMLVHAGTGAVAQRIEYDVLGRVLSLTGAFGADAHPFGFAGGLYDPDTGLVRFGARDYDPETGRFTAKDPSLFAGGLNLYRYAENDPVNLVDPTGRSPVAAIVAAGVFILSMGAILDNHDEVSTLQTLSVMALIAGMGCLAPGPKPAAPPTMHGCFTGDTEVMTSEGAVPIAEVAVGDEVWSFDAASGAWGWRRVSEVFVHPHEGRVYRLGIGDEVIEVTGNHPVCVASGEALAERPVPLDIGEDPLECGEGGRWVEAGGVLVGDAVVLADGESTVLSVSSHEASLAVYNISVAGWQTYAVSAEGLLVHNKAAKAGNAGGTGAGKGFPESVKAKARAESGGKCVFCGRQTTKAPGPTKSEIDHAIPKSRGGNNTLENAQNACRTCNRQKGARTTDEFME